MRVLFLGEYSSLYNNLKEGLNYYNVDSKIVARGDGFKKINIDIKWGLNGKGNFIQKILNKINSMLKVLILSKKSDVVMIINPEFFDFPLGIIYFKIIKCLNKSLYLTCAGDDYFYINYGNKYRYFPYYNEQVKDIPYMKYKDLKLNKIIADNVKKIIPNLYEYSQPYKENYSKKLTETIPMPINIDKIKYTENVVKDKIVIFHGVNREGFKGTKYIREAMEKIEKKYIDRVEIIIDGKMPLNDYLKVMDEANIIIDQCKSYGYGMNALYSLAKGKVLLSGAEKETLDDFNIDLSPIVNITPSVEDIYNKIEYFILNKEEIKRYGEWSRRYVEEIHNYKNIAKKYLDIWR